MSDFEALQEANRRWGERGYVRHHKGEEHVYKVGVRAGEIFLVKGAGKTWEDAFAGADGHEPEKVSA